ncbi:MAG: S9 family peptidase, partial [Verrucomicrobiota bacterium]
MSHAEVDPYLWLEDVEADKALDWARALNQESYQWLAGEPLFTSLKQRMLETLDSDQRIPYATQHGAHLYNFWTDQQNPKGLWRRTTLESYRRADTQWEILLNLD